MKIDSESPITNIDTSVRTTPIKSTTNKNIAAESDKTTRTDRTKRNKEALLRWFAQVGIRPSEDVEQSTDVTKQISRREHILAYNKLRNLRNILDLALEVNIDNVRNEQVDPDWFFTFSKLAEDIYAPAMQSLWSKIAAVEISQPGSFSLRTLHLLTQLTQRDAKIFNRAASIASIRKSDSTPRVIVGFARRNSFWQWFAPQSQRHLNLAQFGLTYPNMLSLIDMGLIFASEIETGELDPTVREQWRCADSRFGLAPHRAGTALVYYKFTSVGSELFRLANKKAQPDYVEHLHGLLSHAFEVS